MKRIISLILTFVLIITIASSATYASYATDNSELSANGLYLSIDNELIPVNRGDVYTYTFCLNIGGKVGSLDATTKYDKNALLWIPELDEENEVDDSLLFPIINSGGSLVSNYEIKGEIIFNYSSIKGKLFDTDNSILITTKFLITANKGIYSIDTNINTLADSNDHVFVQQSKVKDSNFTKHNAVEFCEHTELSPLGDANNDGNVTSADVTIIQMYLTGLIGEDRINLQNVRTTNKDVSIVDATRIQHYMTNIIDEL